MSPTLQVTHPSPQELRLTREFAAASSDVFLAFALPTQLRHWWGCAGSTLTTCDVDFRVGGKWHFGLTLPDSRQLRFDGEYLEIVPSERLVHTVHFGGSEALQAPAIETVVFAERESRTLLETTIRYPSQAQRETDENAGIVQGSEEAYERLEHWLATWQTAWPRVRVTRQFAAPAANVFDAWVTPAALGQWMFGPQVREEEILHLQTEAVTGGRFSFRVRRSVGEIDHVGMYVEVRRPQRLVFTWGVVGHSTDESVVTIDLQENAEGCELQLTHVIPPQWAEYADRTQAGWQTMTTALEKFLGRN